ncbi:MAG: hypothetical protein HY318_18975 [Armatimonadetes bacterium]|nr:hypothetical protein [Armatimonadota bacterium]
MQVIRQQRREINYNIASSQREWEAITFGEPTSGPRLEAQAPTPESVAEHVRGTRGNRFRHLNRNLSRELAGMQAYLEEDTKRQVLALAFRHRWTLFSRQQRQVPDRTQQVIDELRREAWNKVP